MGASCPPMSTSMFCASVTVCKARSSRRPISRNAPALRAGHALIDKTSESRQIDDHAIGEHENIAQAHRRPRGQQLKFLVNAVDDAPAIDR